MDEMTLGQRFSRLRKPTVVLSFGMVILALPCALVTCAVVCGCSSTPRHTQMATTHHYPQVMLKDDTLVCWDTRPGSVDVFTVKEGKPVRAGSYPCPGPVNWPISDLAWVSSVSDGPSGPHSVRLYDLSTEKPRTLIKHAVICQSQYPVSPDGRMILVTLKGDGNATGVINTASGRFRPLLRNAVVWDAIWSREEASVIFACTLEDEPKSITLRKVYLNESRTRRLWGRPMGSVRRVRCSPDGQHIAYMQDSTLVCESLTSKRCWAVTEGKDSRPADDYTWSRDGRRLAALTTSEPLRVSFVDSGRQSVSTAEVDEKGTAFMLGWLADDRHLAVKLVDVKPRTHRVIAIFNASGRDRS